MDTLAQQELFGSPAILPQGLAYEPGFIDGDEEARLTAAIERLPLHEADYRGYAAKRRIIAFGEGYDASAGEHAGVPPLPAPLRSLQARVAAWLAIPAESLAHVLVTQYLPGTPIGWHRDAPQFGMVAGVSLAGPCRMRFKPFGGSRGDILALTLMPRSVYVLRGAIRWGWQHSIPPTPGLRYSVTFRTLRG